MLLAGLFKIQNSCVWDSCTDPQHMRNIYMTYLSDKSWHVAFEHLKCV